MKLILILLLIFAAIFVPIFVLTKRAVMPSQAQLVRLDELVKETVPTSTVTRLSAPYKINQRGETKSGYFTYSIHNGEKDKRVHVEWQIEHDTVRLLSVTEL